MAIEHLLDEFPPVSTTEWEGAIARDLKGADYEKKLIWHTEDGLAVKPYYRAEDLQNLPFTDQAPGDFPFQRGARVTGDWTIREEIDATAADEANRDAVAAVDAGAEGIAFTTILPKSAAELELLLANLGEIPLHFANADENLLRLLVARCQTRNGAAISTGCDALASVETAANVIQTAPCGLVLFAIHADRFEEAGATTIEEIGFALSAGADFLAAMQERGVDVNRAAISIEFHFAIGGNYFFQIAKLRAFRMLWARVVQSFGAKNEASRARISARTSRWNKSIYDPHVNVLRATTEAMAAILGGADAVTVAPFDESYRDCDASSRRLARNTQLLLKHEAWLGRVADPGGGSYFLEAITESLAREAWRLMQEIEAMGGYRKAETDGRINQTLDRSMTAREEAVARRRRIFIGANQFANPTERALNRIHEDRLNHRRRGSLSYEQLRLHTERFAAEGHKTPQVLLAEIGDVKMRVARSNFAMNFFACAGFEVVTKRFKSAAEIAEAEADLTVLCSADAEYAGHVAELKPKLQACGRTTPVIVAGNPENAEQLKAAGVADFVHIRSNPLEVLTKWQERLGIKN
jgi:methylmalonyl-CoA mutase